MKAILIFLVLVTITSGVYADSVSVPEKTAQEVFGQRKGAFVLIDCSSNAISIFDPEASSEKLPPCSTFKIWNTLIGLESGVIHSSNDAFYKWDGQKRFIPDWNRDLTLKEAFQVSCVPAFQSLARKIGEKRIQASINKIGYGDRDISAGVDVFWLPAPGRKTILITPEAQARLIARLVSHDLPFSKNSLETLKEMMALKETNYGTLYGKTGTMVDDDGKFVMGWFVGYVEHNGKFHAFAATLKGEGMMGKDARVLVETILEKQGVI